MWNFDPDALRPYGAHEREEDWQHTPEGASSGSAAAFPAMEPADLAYRLANLHLWAQSHAGGSMSPPGSPLHGDDSFSSMRHHSVSVLRADAPPPQGTDGRYAMPGQTVQRIDSIERHEETAGPSATPRRGRGMLGRAGGMLGRILRTGRSTTHAPADGAPPSTSHAASGERADHWAPTVEAQASFPSTAHVGSGDFPGSSAGSWAPPADSEDMFRRWLTSDDRAALAGAPDFPPMQNPHNANTVMSGLPPMSGHLHSGQHVQPPDRAEHPVPAELEAQSLYLPVPQSDDARSALAEMTPTQAVHWHYNRMADLALIRLYRRYSDVIKQDKGDENRGAAALYRFATYLSRNDLVDSLGAFLNRYSNPGLSADAHSQLAAYLSAQVPSRKYEESRLRNALNLLADCAAEDRASATAPDSWHDMEIPHIHATFPLPPQDAVLVEGAPAGHRQVLTPFAFYLLRAEVGGLSRWLAMSNDDRAGQARQLMADFESTHPRSPGTPSLYNALDALQKRAGIPSGGRVRVANKRVFIGEPRLQRAAPTVPSVSSPPRPPQTAPQQVLWQFDGGAPTTASALNLPPKNQRLLLPPEDQRVLSRLRTKAFTSAAVQQRDKHLGAATRFATHLVEKHGSSISQWLDMHHQGQAATAKARLDHYIETADPKATAYLAPAVHRLQALQGAEEPDTVYRNPKLDQEPRSLYPDGFPANEAHLIDQALAFASLKESSQAIYQRALVAFSNDLRAQRSEQGEGYSLQYVLDLERRGERQTIKRLRDDSLTRLNPSLTKSLKSALRLFLKSVSQQAPEPHPQNDPNEEPGPSFLRQDDLPVDAPLSFGYGPPAWDAHPGMSQHNSEAAFRDFIAGAAAAPGQPQPAGSYGIFDSLSSLGALQPYQDHAFDPGPLAYAPHEPAVVNDPNPLAGNQPQPHGSNATFDSLSSLSAPHPYRDHAFDQTISIQSAHSPNEPAIVSVAQRLVGNAWLRGDDLHNYTRRLASQLRGQPNAQLLRFVDPIQIQSLLTDDERRRNAVLRRLTGPQAAPILFVPVNNNDTHWSLLVIDRTRNQSFHYDSSVAPYDAYSANWTEQFAAANRISSALGAPDPIGLPIAMQYDAHSCGDHVLTGIDVLARRVVSGQFFLQDNTGLDLSHIEPNRQHILNVLINVEARDAERRNRSDS